MFFLRKMKIQKKLGLTLNFYSIHFNRLICICHEFRTLISIKTFILVVFPQTEKIYLGADHCPKASLSLTAICSAGDVFRNHLENIHYEPHQPNVDAPQIHNINHALDFFPIL